MPGDTTQQTLEASAQLAKPPGAPPLPKAITPEEAPAQGDDSTRMAELQFKMEQAQKKLEDKNEKEKITLRGEVERLRQQLEFQKQQQQLEAQQRKNLDAVRQKEEGLRRAEQDIARQQAMAEAQIAKRQAESEAALAQERADATAALAEQEAKRYIKTTDEARRSADKYYASQQAKLDKREDELRTKANAPSAILQDRMTALNNRVKNMTRIRSKLQGTRGVYMDEAMPEKSAAVDATLQQNSAAAQASSSATNSAAAKGDPSKKMNSSQGGSALSRAISSHNSQNSYNRALSSSNYAGGSPDYGSMSLRDMAFHDINYKKDAKDIEASGGAAASAGNMFKSLAQQEGNKQNADIMAKRQADLKARAANGDQAAKVELAQYNTANTKTYRKEFDREMSEFDLANMSPEEREALSKQVADRRKQDLKNSFWGGPLDWAAKQVALGKDYDGILGIYQNIARGFTGVAGQDNDANAAYNALSILNPAAWGRKFVDGVTDSYHHTQTSNRLAEAAGVERNWWDTGVSAEDRQKDPGKAALYDTFTEAAANRGIQDTSIAKDIMNFGGDAANLALDVATVIPGVGVAGAALKGARAAQLAAKGIQAANVATKGVQAANLATKGVQAANAAARGAQVANTAGRAGTRAWVPAVELGTDMGAQAASGALFGPEQRMYKEQLGESYNANSPYWNNANNANNMRRTYLHGANMMQKVSARMIKKAAAELEQMNPLGVNPNQAQHVSTDAQQSATSYVPPAKNVLPATQQYKPMSPRATYNSRRALSYGGGNILDHQFVLGEPKFRTWLRRAAPYIQNLTGYSIYTPDTSVLFNKADPYQKAQIMAGIQNAFNPDQVNRSTGPLTAAGAIYNEQLLNGMWDQHNKTLHNYAAANLGL